MEVVLALHTVGGLAHLLDGGEQEADEDGDDRDHHQQLDQREYRKAPGIRQPTANAIHDDTIGKRVWMLDTGLLIPPLELPCKKIIRERTNGGRQLQNGWKNGSLQALGGESWKLLPP